MKKPPVAPKPDLHAVVEALAEASTALTEMPLGRREFPSRMAVAAIVEDLRALLFPGYFGASELTLDTLRFRIQSSLFLPDGRQAGLEQARRLARLLAQRPDFFLSQQVSQQRLDFGIAVGAQLPLALRREHRREEGVGAAAECFDATGIGVHLAV